MFIVIEFQKTAVDTIATIVNTYTDRGDAESKYHLILTSAAKTTLLKHGATMLTEDGAYIKSEAYGTNATIEE